MVKVEVSVTFTFTDETGKLKLGRGSFSKIIEMPTSPAGLSQIVVSVGQGEHVVLVNVNYVYWHQTLNRFVVGGKSHELETVKELLSKDPTWQQAEERRVEDFIAKFVTDPAS